MKYNKYLILLFLIVLASGCKKFLQEDPQGLLIGDVALQNVDGLKTQLAGAYSCFVQGWDMGFASAGQIAASMGGDDVTTHPGLNKAEFREFDQFNASAFNARSYYVWAGCYKIIQCSNNIINNYQKTKGDETTIQQIAGEAYFLRGFAYYYLVRWWGKIPLIKTAEFSRDLLTTPKSEITDVYKQIESDLTTAEQMVGDTKVDQGRINQGTVKAYLAAVYLTETGWPVKDASKAALAAAKAKEVIDNHGKYGFALFQGDYQKIFTDAYSEYVFAIMTNGNTVGNCFYGASARPSDEAGGWDDYCAEINFFKNFPEGNRKNGTFSTEFEVNGTLKSWDEIGIKHPYYKKFRIQSGDTLSYVSNSPIIFMRYSEVLLTYAEAEARASSPNADAYSAINAVRKRAGLDDLTPGLNSTDFIKAVIQERAWEFAGEWHRWFDLVRTETVKEANSHRDSNEIPLIGDPGDQKNWLLPIPAGDASYLDK
jgi:hypothetical protein